MCECLRFHTGVLAMLTSQQRLTLQQNPWLPMKNVQIIERMYHGLHRFAQTFQRLYNDSSQTSHNSVLHHQEQRRGKNRLMRLHRGARTHQTPHRMSSSWTCGQSGSSVIWTETLRLLTLLCRLPSPCHPPRQSHWWPCSGSPTLCPPPLLERKTARKRAAQTVCVVWEAACPI